MADVELAIGGHAYRITCAEGQEEALYQLAAILDAKIEDQKIQSGALSEVRQLLFAALTLADEAKELRTSLEQWEALAPRLAEVGVANRAMENMALRMENLANDLEKQVPAP